MSCCAVHAVFGAVGLESAHDVQVACDQCVVDYGDHSGVAGVCALTMDIMLARRNRMEVSFQSSRRGNCTVFHVNSGAAGLFPCLWFMPSCRPWRTDDDEPRRMHSPAPKTAAACQHNNHAPADCTRSLYFIIPPQASTSLFISVITRCSRLPLIEKTATAHALVSTLAPHTTTPLAPAQHGEDQSQQGTAPLHQYTQNMYAHQISPRSKVFRHSRAARASTARCTSPSTT